MDDKFQEKAIFIFNLIGGIILFLFGLAIIAKNLFIVDELNPYEMVFGVQFISAGIFMVYGKFKGIKTPSG